MKRRKKIIFFVLSLLLLGFQLCFHLPIVYANPYSSDMTPAPKMPSIIIDSQGNINPENMSFQKKGKFYNLIGNINDYYIEINCPDIILNGNGFALEARNRIYAPSSGIIIRSDGVTIQNMNLLQYKSASVLVLGSNNIVIQNNIKGSGSGVEIRGSHNVVKNNTINNGGITLGGKFNNIIGNSLTKNGIFMIGSIRGAPNEIVPNYSMIVGNTIKDCKGVTFGVYLSVGTHFFYLNNFINNENGNISPFRWQLTLNNEPTNEWTSATRWVGIYPNDTLFDNGVLGNYWSDYESVDANQDGIGDTSYEIGGILKDHYPLMNPFDIEKANIELPDWTYVFSLFQINSTLTKPSPMPTSTISPTPTVEPLSSPMSSPEQSLQLLSTLKTATITVLVIITLSLVTNLIKKRKNPK